MDVDCFSHIKGVEQNKCNFTLQLQRPAVRFCAFYDFVRSNPWREETANSNLQLEADVIMLRNISKEKKVNTY